MLDQPFRLEESDLAPLALPQGFDLLSADLAGAAGARLGLTAEALEAARASQRLARLGCSAPLAQRLRAAGYTSAQSIAAVTESHFVRRAAPATGTDEATLRTLHGRARTTRARVHHLWAGLQSRLGAHERALRVLPDSAAYEALLPDLPDYPSLFGSVNYCECPHCRSVFGPAAYFTDLMRVTATYITGGNTIPPGYGLQARRPDLFEMPLTCENTNTPLRFLHIANRVMGRKIADSMDGTDVDYIAATRTLSPLLPLNLPLVTAREALQRMQTSLAAVYGVLQGPEASDLPQASQVQRERLGLSVEQQRVARTPTPDAAQLAVYYDVPSITLVTDLPGTYAADKDARTVTASDETFHGTLAAGDTLFVAGVARIVTEVPATGTTFTVDTAFGTAFTGAAAQALPAGSIARLPVFRKATGLSWDEVISLLRQRLDPEELAANLAAYFYVNGATAAAAWTDVVEDETDPAALVQYLARVRVENGVRTVAPLDLAALDRLNRFSRLARWLGWSYEELDVALRAAKPPTLDTDATYALLAETAVFARSYRLAVDQAAALWSDMNTYGRGPSSAPPVDLFDRVYNRPHLQNERGPYRPVYAANPLFTTPVIEWTLVGEDPENTGTRAWLAGSLGFTSNDLTLAAQFAAGESPVLPLTVPALSALYRLRLLSTSLRLSVADLLAVFGLLGITTATPTASQVAEVAALATSLAEAGVSVGDVVYLTTGTPPRGYRPPLSTDLVLPFLKGLWTQSQEWLVTVAELQASTQTPEEAQAARDALVAKGYLDARGLVTITATVFRAAAVPFAVTAAELESPGLVSEGQAQDALARLRSNLVVDADGVLLQPVDANTNLDDTFPPSPAQPSQISWVRTLLEARTGLALFALVSPLLPLSAASFVVGPITPAEAAAAFALLVEDGVLLEGGALAAPFPPDADLSDLFHGDAAKAELARGVLDDASDVVWHTALAVLNGYNAQQYGTWKELAALLATSPAMASVLAPDAAAAVSLAQPVVALLTPIPEGEPLPPAVLAFFGLYARLVTAAARFRLAPWDMEGAVEHPAVFGFASVNALTLEVLQSLAAYAAFTRRFGLGTGQLIPVLVFPDNTFAALSLLTGWDRGQIQALAKAFWPPQGAGWNTVPHLARMAAVFRQAGAIGLDVYSMLKLGAVAGLESMPFPPLDGPDATKPEPPAEQWEAYVAAGQAMYDTLAARYDDAQWAEVSAALESTVDEQRRDAYVPLALFALSTTKPPVPDVRALSEYLLLDVEMSGCDVTSKVAQGIASVQTYMQRCRLRLEPGIARIDFPAVWWEWLSAYRVWEANRKIYVYPENYLEPAIRRRKTPLFDALMDSLNQGEVTDESVHRAFVDYMDGFAQQAAIQVSESLRATAPDPWSGAPADTLFLVGRSPTAPNDVYLRRLVDDLAWTVWEKVDVKITAENVVPVWSMGRLFLFWVETEPVELSNMGGDGASVKQTNALSWQVRLTYSWQQFNGTWTAPQVAGENNVFAFKGYVPSPAYAPWGIDVNSISPQDPFWHRPYPLSVPADDPSQERLVLFWGQAWQETTEPEVLPPPPTPFGDLDRLLREVQAAATFGSAVVENGFVGAVPLLQGFTLDPSLRATRGQVVMQTTQASKAFDSLYAAVTEAVTEDDNAVSQLSLFLSTNLYVANALGDSPLLTITNTDLNPWFAAGPRPILYNLAPGIAWTRPVRNQVGWSLWNNGDEAFLARAVVPGVKTVSEVTRLNPVTIQGPTDIVLFPSGAPGPVPDLDTVQTKFVRLTAPAVQRVSRILRAQGVPAMLSTMVQADPGPAGLSFTRFYTAGQAPAAGACDPASGATPPAGVVPPAQLCGGQIDFGRRGEPSAYGLYWWEVYFHVPYLVATQLNTHLRFEEAKAWWEYVFNPTTDDTVTPGEDRFWRFLPFRGLTPPTLVEILSDPEALKAWNNHPFDPFAIADLRPSAYQKAVVTRYIENLLDWGDARFAQDTRESITEATLLYTLAADLLGPRPVSRGPCPQQPPMNFNQILDEYGDPSQIPQFLIHLEQQLPPVPAALTVSEDALPFNEINAYFCVPENPELVALWDTVEDRLFKIRHCMNLDGVVRPLPMFAPPLDPALLAAGAAAGNLRDIIQGAQAAIPHYRFWTMLERARTLTQTLTGFGGSLLAALQARDAEALALLQNTQQQQVLQLTIRLKEQAVEEQVELMASIQEQLSSAQYRESYYQGLVSAGLSGPEIAGIVNMVAANVFALLGGIYHTVAGVSFLIPNVGSPFAMTYGGKQIGQSLNAMGTFFDTMSGQFSFASVLSNTIGEYRRRSDEWQNQATLAGYEVASLQRQVAAAKVRQAMAERDLEITVAQEAQAEEMTDFLVNKFTSVELYQWMAGQLSTVYFQAYQTAFTLAAGAQRALQFELNTSDTFVGSTYWNSLRKGLTAGEGLMLSLAQMEEAYLRRNGRRLTIEKTISLMQMDPLALLRLQDTGATTFELPASLFDGDFPGHYARKITALRVTIPTVAGPYENISGTLIQTGSFITLTADPQAELFLLGAKGTEPPGPDQLAVNLKANQQIALSTGMDDGGLAADGGADDRYVPFEGTGAISQWRLELPQATNRIDVSAIPDVVLRLSYTALPGGSTLANPVIAALATKGWSGGRLVFLAGQYSTAWYAFMHPAAGATTQVMQFVTPRTMFPGNVSELELLQAYFSLVLGPDVTFVGPLEIRVRVPGVDEEQTVTFTGGSTLQSIAFDTPVTGFTTQPWTFTVDKEGVPEELRDPVTGLLDPVRLPNLGLVMMVEGTIAWKGGS